LWLAPGLLLGLLFALGQHSRGAHQPSHEPWSIAIAWIVAAGFAALFRRLGWLAWSEVPAGSEDPRAVQADPALPWLVGASVAFGGVAFFATDLVTEQLEMSDPRVHSIFEVVELTATALGLGIGAWLLTDKIASMRLREQRTLEEERERRFQFLGRMAASVAHEVRNPLQTVRLIVDEQRHEVAGLRDHPLQAEFEACLERIDRAVDLVYRLARPESGEADRTDLAEAARESIVSLARISGERVRFAWESEPPRAAVTSSKSALRIVIDNLLRNAVEASPQGATVVLDLRQRGGSWTLDIRNQGSLTAPRARVGSECGLGLGVPISRQIANNAGGGIDIREADGLVTCTLRWPLARESRS
jgi:signal transduction histidine kinase